MNNLKKKYRVITQNENGQLKQAIYPNPESELSIGEFVNQMEAAGFTFIGHNTNKAHRVELLGQPKFRGLLGPMFDGDAIRYESTEAYQQLSA